MAIGGILLAISGDWVFISPGAMITKDIPSESLVGYGFNNILNDDGKRHVEMYLK